MADPRFRDDRDVRDRDARERAASRAPLAGARFAQGLAVAVLVAAAAIYLLAVVGGLGDEATPPLDVGALSTLVVGLLFGLLGLAVARTPA